jgi:hypothetical protein
VRFHLQTQNGQRLGMSVEEVQRHPEAIRRIRLILIGSQPVNG